jgi:segregation and condensation protein A
MPEIRLPTFQGPLDLLLTLIQRRDLDITTVSLVAVADQYLEAVHSDESLDAGALAEFISIGAKLLQLKSRALLPDREEDEEEPEEEDPGEELVALLLEYQRYREAADSLGDRVAAGWRTYPRGAPPPQPPEGNSLDGVTLEALYAVMLEVLERMPEEPDGTVERNDVSLADTIEMLEGRLRGRRRSFSFRSVIESCTSRVEVVVTFIALLELLKRGACEVEQSKAWGDIRVRALVQPAAS